MTEPIRLALNDGPSGIEFLDIEPDGSGGASLQVRLTAPGLRAEKRVYLYSSGSHPLACLASFIQEMADNWRGWAGERAYESLEHDLHITAKHEGHIRMNVNLRVFEHDGWDVGISLTVPPGEVLIEAAANLARLVNENVV